MPKIQSMKQILVLLGLLFALMGFYAVSYFKKDGGGTFWMHSNIQVSPIGRWFAVGRDDGRLYGKIRKCFGQSIG